MEYDRLGIHILPKHYDSPIADYQWLTENEDAWIDRASMTGVEWNLKAQLQWLQGISARYYSEVEGLGFYRDIAASGIGIGLGPIEAQVVHCFIRSVGPARIVEIGGGVSTACMLRAAAYRHLEGKPRPEIVCVEPLPTEQLRQLRGCSLIDQPCQRVSAEVFEQLGPNDLLSVDCSHAVKTGSDVIKIYLDIIPKLARGVFIHIHDSRLPYLYGRRLWPDYNSSQESALLLALLTRNEHLSVRCSLAALHYDETDALAAMLRDYRPQANRQGLRLSSDGHYPSSIWLQTT
jgi:Methyltransferase domain